MGCSCHLGTLAIFQLATLAIVLMNYCVVRLPRIIYSGTLLWHRRTMSNKPQSYASHAKIDPAFHLFVLPVLLINILIVAYLLIRHPGIGGAWLLLVSIGLPRSCRTPAQLGHAPAGPRDSRGRAYPPGGYPSGAFARPYRRTIGFSNRWTALCLGCGTACLLPARSR